MLFYVTARLWISSKVDIDNFISQYRGYINAVPLVSTGTHTANRKAQRSLFILNCILQQVGLHVLCMYIVQFLFAYEYNTYIYSLFRNEANFHIYCFLVKQHMIINFVRANGKSNPPYNFFLTAWASLKRQSFFFCRKLAKKIK